MAYPNLEAEMKRFNYSYSDLANIVGKNERTVSSWMEGKECGFPIPAAFKVKETLFPGKTIDYLFANEPDAN